MASNIWYFFICISIISSGMCNNIKASSKSISVRASIIIIGINISISITNVI